MTDTSTALEGDLGSVLHHAADFVARLDTELRYRYVNAGAGRIGGIPPDGWIGRTTPELGFDADGIPPWSQALRTALESGDAKEVQAPFEVDGRSCWFETRIVPEKDEDGRVTGLVLVARDVTEHVRTVQRLEETTRVLRRTLESLSEAVFVVDPASRTVVDCNPAAVRMFRCDRDDLVGRSTEHLHVDRERFERFGDRVEAELEGRTTVRGYAEMRRRDGSVFPTEHTVTLLDPAEGLGRGVVSVVRDRSEEVRSAEAVRHYNRRLRALRAMDRAMLEARSDDELAAAAATHARTVVDCHRASVTLVEPGRAGARLAAVRGPAAGDREGTHLPSCPFPLDALRPGEPQRVKDIEELPPPRPPILQALLEAGIRSILTMPLGEGAELLGDLTLGFTEPGSLDREVEEGAREMADHLTLALRHNRLEQAVRDEMEERIEAESRARTVQVRLDELLDSLDLGFLRTELDGAIVECNEAARRILRVPANEALIGRHVDSLLGPGETWQGVLGQIRSGGTDHGSVRARIRRDDATPAWISALGRVVRLPEGRTVVEGVFQDNTEEVRLRQEVVEISTEERLRIGQDLHDDLGQHLTGLAFVARDLAGRLEDDEMPEAARQARELEELANTGVKKTRHLARGVQPPALKHRGLHGALEELARDVDDLFGLAVRLRVDESLRTVSPSEASHLFRIAQEAATNAARHGNATSAEIRWEGEADGRILIVRDDGTGFGDSERGPGLGLRIMRYRARLLGGELHVTSEPGCGTSVRVDLPPLAASSRGGRDSGART